MSLPFASLLLAVEDFAAPLTQALSSLEEMEYYFYRFGWRVSLDDASFAELGASLEIVQAAQKISDLASSIRASSGAPDPALLSQLLDAAQILIGGLTKLKPSNLSSLPGALASEALWEDVASQLLDALLEDYLRIHQPSFHLVLYAGGILNYQAVTPDDPARAPYTRPVFDWGQLGDLIDDFTGSLAKAYRWGDPAQALDHVRLMAVLTRLFQVIKANPRPLLPSVGQASGLSDDAKAKVLNGVEGLRTVFFNGYEPILKADYSVGLDVLVGADPPGGQASGLVLQPHIIGAAEQSFKLGQFFTLGWKLSADAGGLLGATVFPGKVALSSGDVALGATLTLTGKPQTPWYLAGDANSARIELRDIGFSVSVEGEATDPELRARLGFDAVDGQPGIQVVIPLGDADGFVGAVASQQTIKFGASPELIWSSRTGFTFNGQPTPTIDIPVGVKLGPITINKAQIKFVADDPSSTGPKSFNVQVGVDFSGAIGPVALAIAGMGFVFRIIPYSHDEIAALPPGTDGPVIGNLGFEHKFAAPNTVGVSIDAGGVVSGGGFIFHDEADSLYGGELQLSIENRLTVKAFGLITTGGPPGAPKFSLVVFITVEDFTPIQLGFGFRLTGIGGMLAIHRTFDEDAIRAGLKSDNLKSLLFPKNPAANAPAVIAALSAAFPAKQGAYLVGLLVQIGWPTPTLVELDLALILEFGDRSRLLVLGRISALLPNRDNDLIRINLDAMGVLDFDEGTISIDAVLVDSRLAHRYPLTGAMALRAGFGSGPGSSFVMAIGGLNQRFAPPAGLPDLPRIAIALSSGNNPRLTCEAYFAITANTVQFGARTNLYAAAYGFSIEGGVGFDVLIELSPIHFIADLYASLQLKHGSTNLFKVTLDGELEGPKPLKFSGKASFEIFWCDFSIAFDKTLVEGDPPPPPPAIDVTAQLKAALVAADAWSSEAGGHGVALRGTPIQGGAALDPASRLILRQRIVPLNTSRQIDTYGGAPVAQARSFNLSVSLGGAAQNDAKPVQDQFAPAQFFAMEDDEKLAAPSFEIMDAGLVFGEVVAFDGAASVEAGLEYETFTFDDEAAPPPADKPPYVVNLDQLKLLAKSGSAGRAASRRTGRQRFANEAAAPAVTVKVQTWVVAPLGEVNATPPAEVSTNWTELQAVVRQLNRTGAAFELTPSHEIAA